MKDISLKQLLEAGCHFGHRVEKWHPKASAFIFEAREGIHIIDLAKTRDALRKAQEYVKKLGEEGKNLLMVGTKRQAKGAVGAAAKKGELPYFTSRWVGGFITNWSEVSKNINKLNTAKKESQDGSWKKFPKHEIIQLEKHMHKLEAAYGGVAQLAKTPDAIFIVDIRREVSSLKEAARCGIPTVAIVDTNTNPNSVDYPIYANDDAVGSIELIVNALVDAYLEGKAVREKREKKETAATGEKAVGENKMKEEKETIKPIQEKKTEEDQKPAEKKTEVEAKKEKKTKKTKHVNSKSKTPSIK